MKACRGRVEGDLKQICPHCVRMFLDVWNVYQITVYQYAYI